MYDMNEMKGGELRGLAEDIIRSRSASAQKVPKNREYHQQMMDDELTSILVIINDRAKAIAKKYKKTFRPLDLRGIKADQDAVLGRGGLQ